MGTDNTAWLLGTDAEWEDHEAAVIIEAFAAMCMYECRWQWLARRDGKNIAGGPASGIVCPAKLPSLLGTWVAKELAWQADDARKAIIVTVSYELAEAI